MGLSGPMLWRLYRGAAALDNHRCPSEARLPGAGPAALEETRQPWSCGSNHRWPSRSCCRADGRLEGKPLQHLLTTSPGTLQTGHIRTRKTAVRRILKTPPMCTFGSQSTSTAILSMKQKGGAWEATWGPGLRPPLLALRPCQGTSLL